MCHLITCSSDAGSSLQLCKFTNPGAIGDVLNDTAKLEHFLLSLAAWNAPTAARTEWQLKVTIRRLIFGGIAMVSNTRVSRDFIRQLAGYGLTTAEILYRLPDHPRFLQSYIWQDYDVAPDF